MGLVWYDTETVFMNFYRWGNLLTNTGRGDPKLFMTDGDRAALEAMPDELTVYRGYRPDCKNENGFSWTLDRNVAERLGNRAWMQFVDDKPLGDPQNRGRVIEKVVKKSEIFAYLTERGEAEIILLPKRG